LSGSLEEGGVDARVNEDGLQRLDSSIVDESLDGICSTLTGGRGFFVGESLDDGIRKTNGLESGRTIFLGDSRESRSSGPTSCLISNEKSRDVELAFNWSSSGGLKRGRGRGSNSGGGSGRHF